MRSSSGSVGGGDAQVGDIVALFEGRDGVDVENDGGYGGAGFGDDFADVIGDGAEFHAGGDVRAVVDEGVSDSGPAAADVAELFEQSGVFDWAMATAEQV